MLEPADDCPSWTKCGILELDMGDIDSQVYLSHDMCTDTRLKGLVWKELPLV
jgi:hypothetical protein